MTTALPDEADFDLSERQPWDRLAGEPVKAYGAFRIYRDLPPIQRSFDSVAESANLSARRCRDLATRWDWRNRSGAWDEACHRIDDRERLDAIRSMHSIHRRAGRAAIMKGLQALTMLDAENMPATVIARLMELGAKLERSTLIVSVEELQGIDVESDEDAEDPWERISRELDPANAAVIPDL